MMSFAECEPGITMSTSGFRAGKIPYQAVHVSLARAGPVTFKRLSHRERFLAPYDSHKRNKKKCKVLKNL